MRIQILVKDVVMFNRDKGPSLNFLSGKAFFVKSKESKVRFGLASALPHSSLLSPMQMISK